MDTIQNLIQNEVEQRLIETGSAVDVILPNMQDDYTPRNRQIILTPIGTERAPEHDCQGNPPACGWNTTFNVRVIVRQDEDATPTSIDSVLSKMTGNAMTALTSPPAWWTFGGNAINSEITETVREIDDLSLAAYQFTLLVWYRTDETNIFNRR